MKLKHIVADKVTLILLIFSIAAFVQWFIIGQDCTIGFGIVLLFILRTMCVVGRMSDYNLKQSLEIKELNRLRFEKDQFITELIKKYGVTTKAQKSFSERLKESFKKQNLSNADNSPSKV